MGMAISTYLAYMKGIVSRPDLERTLNLILDMGLPIYLKEHDCCNPNVLWDKIRTEGIEHKDGMLWLTVPETIGRGTFLDNISDIDADMVSETVRSLRRYAMEKSAPRTNGIDAARLAPCEDGLMSENGEPSSSPLTAAIIGASGDIGSHLADYLVHKGVRVIGSVRSASLQRFKTRVDWTRMRVYTGDVLGGANLRVMIQEADVIYNMAGFVTLSAKPDEYARVIAVNGFAQAIITDLIHQMGREQAVKVIYPSSQRVHLTLADPAVDVWIQAAEHAYSAHKETLGAEQDLSPALESFARQFLADHPLPAGHNVYEISKRLGEHFVSLLPRHSLMRISGVYGPAFTRGFISRGVDPRPKGNVEESERNDFIYIDDLNELLWKTAQTQTADGDVFDGASGECRDLQEVWGTARELVGDGVVGATVPQKIVYKDDLAPEVLETDLTFARHLLGRGTVPLNLELYKTFQPKPSQTHRGNQDRPHVIVLDVGATYLRAGVLDSQGLLLPTPVRMPTPSKHSYPQDTLAQLQERLVETISRQIELVRARHVDLSLEEVGIAFGAVITNEGMIEDASILWSEPARGYDLQKALRECLPCLRLTILNDVSAAAWRYQDERRFCLITVSSGLSNKVFDGDRLDLDAAGLGGEMGHVIVEPRAVDALVRHAIWQATARPEEFQRSQLHNAVHVAGNAQKIDAQALAKAVRDGDAFAVRLLEEADVPSCACGNLADLCSYSSGRGALRQAQRLAARGHYGPLLPELITDSWLQEAIATGHPLARKVLHDATYPLALRILQLAADIGLDKFIIRGGFAMKTAQGVYLAALQDHLVRLCYRSAFYSGWQESQVRGLVRLGVEDDDDDGLIGVGRCVQHSHANAEYLAVVKTVGERSLAVEQRRIPRCGAREVLAKVVFSGICTTDLQILRGERGLEPMVLGHEAVCQVMDVGRDTQGVSVGAMIVLNPNNPVDEHDKLGHSREGVLQQYVKFGQECVDRGQVLTLAGSVSATDTLVEPLSCVVAGLSRLQDRIAGKNVLVVGAGTMGLLFVMALAHSKKNGGAGAGAGNSIGARQVFLANRSQAKLDFAVARGIIHSDKAFVLGGDVAAQVEGISAGEGVDVVVVALPLGQGQLAAQAALSCVNARGCVYLFGGFRPGDILAGDAGAQADITAIRSAATTEVIQRAGKPVYLSGHRGSQKADMATALKWIRDAPLSFGRIISHVISLDMLPEIMLGLARDGTIRGEPAQRVIVDMSARNSVVESLEELPLRHLHNATRTARDVVPVGNVFREIGFEGTTSLLGWVCPPAWQQIEITLTTALQHTSLRRKRHIIFVGTGAWVFLVDVLKEVVPASASQHTTPTMHTLQSLDPQALVDLFSHVKDLSTTVCLGISQSGRTTETVLLMNTLRERFDGAGLDYREHFVWLTDIQSRSDPSQSQSQSQSGDAAIRASKEHDWEKVHVLPLTFQNHRDINALFCAPHSVVTFLTLTFLLGNETQAVWPIYQQYLALSDAAVHSILPTAYSIASNHIEHLQVNLDESIAPAMGRLVTQLIEQSLGSKQLGFNPRVRVASCGEPAESGLIALPMPPGTPAAVEVMLTMNALAVFVAAVAYHKKITFVTHPKVDLYKRKAIDLMAGADSEQSTVDAGPIEAAIIAHLSSNPQMRFVEVLCYGLVSVSFRQSVKNWLASCLVPKIPSTSIDVVRGEEWNHSVYQAAVQTEDTLYVILALQNECCEVEGISQGTITGNIRTLSAIARATHETLLPKALYFRVSNGLVEGQGLDDCRTKAS